MNNIPHESYRVDTNGMSDDEWTEYHLSQQTSPDRKPTEKWKTWVSDLLSHSPNSYVHEFVDLLGGDVETAILLTVIVKDSMQYNMVDYDYEDLWKQVRLSPVRIQKSMDTLSSRGIIAMAMMGVIIPGDGPTYESKTFGYRVDLDNCTLKRLVENSRNRTTPVELDKEFLLKPDGGIKEKPIKRDRHCTNHEWFDICASFGFCCLKCGKKFNLFDLTKDHIIPRSKNGSHDKGNMQPLCKSCNSSKGNRSSADYRKSLAL